MTQLAPSFPQCRLMPPLLDESPNITSIELVGNHWSLCPIYFLSSGSRQVNDPCPGTQDSLLDFFPLKNLPHFVSPPTTGFPHKTLKPTQFSSLGLSCTSRPFQPTNWLINSKNWRLVWNKFKLTFQCPNLYSAPGSYAHKVMAPLSILTMCLENQL